MESDFINDPAPHVFLAAQSGTGIYKMRPFQELQIKIYSCLLFLLQIRKVINYINPS